MLNFSSPEPVLKVFVNAVLAGICIAIAGTVFLSVSNPGFGAFLFGFGLMTILCYRFKLFTGAVGYLANQSPAKVPGYLVFLVTIWLGNLAGCFLVGKLLRASRVFPNFQLRVNQMVQTKLSDGALSIFILAVFCGLLMFIAVDGFKKEENHPVFRWAGVFLCVMVFILCGFEHCVANMFYFAVSGSHTCHTLVWLLVMTLGNSIGGMLIPALRKFRY